MTVQLIIGTDTGCVREELLYTPISIGIHFLMRLIISGIFDTLPIAFLDFQQPNQHDHILRR